MKNNVKTHRAGPFASGHLRQRTGLKNRILIVAGGILGTGVMAVAMLAVLPSVPPFKQQILLYVNRQASSLLECNTTIGSITLDAWHRRMAVGHISLSGRHDGNDPLHIDKVAADIDFAALLKRRISIRSITITGLNGALVKTRHGLFAGPVDIKKLVAHNHKPAVKPAAIKEPMIRSITLENCTVSYIDSVVRLSTGESIQSGRLDFIRNDSISFVLHAGAGYFSSFVWSGGVRSFDVQGFVGPKSIRFKNADITGDSIQLSVAGTIPFTEKTAWDLSADARTYTAKFHNVIKAIPAFTPEGKLKATAVMRGTIKNPVLNATVSGYAMHVGPVQADSLFLKAQYSMDRLSGKISAWTPQGRADASVQATVTRLFLSPAVGSYIAEASAGHIDLRRFMAVSPRWRRVAFPASARFHAAGRGVRSLPDTLSVDIRELRGSLAARPIVASLHLGAHRWDLTAAMKPDCEIQGKGDYTDSGAVSGSFHIQADNITPVVSFFSKEPSSGTLIGDVIVSGTLKNPAVSALFQAGRCTYGRFSIDTISAQCRYAGKSLQWESLHVRRDSSAMQSSGMVSWKDRSVSITTSGDFASAGRKAGTLSAQARVIGASVDASVTAATFDPVILAPWFPSANQLQGSLGLTGTMKGTPDNPVIALNFIFDRPVAGSRILTAAGDLATANGSATAAITVVQKGLANPMYITAAIPFAFKDRAKGFAAIQNGASISLQGDSVSYGDLVHAFAPLVESPGNITVHGAMRKTSGEWALSCSTHIVNRELIVKSERIKAGPALLDLVISGPLARPSARFIFKGDAIKYRGDLITAYAGSGSIANGAATLDSLHIAVPEGNALLSARMAMTLKNGLSFDKNSRISMVLNALPFSIMQPFMPDVVSINKGVISGSVVVKGIAGDIPSATGALSLRKGELYLYDCNNPLGPVTADIDFKNNRVSLRRLTSGWGGGQVTGSGWADLGAKGVADATLRVTMRDVRLAGCYENLNLGMETADITLKKDSLFTITANAKLADSRFTQDYSLFDISERVSRKRPKGRRPHNPLFDKVVMRIAVDLNSNLTFDSNLGRMLLDGNVAIAGRPDKPGISGQFQVLDGFVYYLDRKFTVTQGSIRQYDPQVINPLLTIAAVSTVSWFPKQGGKKDYDINLLVKGDLANPLVTLSASPALSQPQIISLLTFGTIQTGIGSDAGSRTGTIVSQQLTGFGTRRLARLLNLESVDLYGDPFDSTSGPASGLQLSVSKQLSSRVSMTYTTGLSRTSRQIVLVSYRLLPFLYLEAETDQQARGGIDLKFRYSH